MSLPIARQQEPVRQETRHLQAGRDAADEAQVGFTPERLEETVERLPEGRITEVAEASSATRDREQAARVEPEESTSRFDHAGGATRDITHGARSIQSVHSTYPMWTKTKCAGGRCTSGSSITVSSTHEA